MSTDEMRSVHAVVEVAAGDPHAQEMGVLDAAQRDLEDEGIVLACGPDERVEGDGGQADGVGRLEAAGGRAHAEVLPVVIHGSSVSHCPACRVVSELSEHRDATAGGWSIRRGTLNFAIVIARQACPAYVASSPSVVDGEEPS